MLLSNCSPSEEFGQIQQEQIETRILTIDIEGANLFFGKVVRNIEVTKKITISNQGNSSVNIASISLPDGFSSDWSGGSIIAGSSKEIIITFKPDKIAKFTGSLEITSNANEEVYTSSFSGEGISEVYEGDISFQTDAQIEEFINKGYTAVTGELCIGLCFDRKPFNANDITTLTDLSSIESVEILKISHCEALKNLDGIQQISISKQLTISNCSLLTNVDELDTIGSIPSISIFSNNSLQNIDGLQNLESAFSIGISKNEQLKNVDGLVKLTESAYLRIFDNTQLENLNGLKNIRKIGKQLYLGGSDILTNIDALENISQIGESIYINNLPQIGNLNGLRNVVDFNGIISINRNRLLSDYCAIQVLLQSSRSNTIKLNRYNPAISAIRSGICEREVPLNVYDLDIVIRGQKELDYFLSLAYDTIEGDFTVQSNNNSSESEVINSIAELGLKTILGNLELNDLNITSLEGLNSLEYVKGDLIITDNQKLLDFCAITEMIQNKDGFQNYLASGNLLNPSLQDLIDNNCN